MSHSTHISLTIKEGKDKSGFVLHMKWYFPQGLRCYDYLHEPLFVLLTFAKSHALYSHSGIWHRDVECPENSRKGIIKNIRKQDFGE